MSPIAKPAFERFEEKVYRQETGCWLWLGTKARGYGRFRPGGIQGKVPAHRFAYEHYVGPIPDGFVCDHLCRNRACVNPGHIELVTSRDNVLRGVGPTARAAQVTHCPAGHPYDVGNTYYDPRGCRVCRTCHRDWARKHKRGGANGEL